MKSSPKPSKKFDASLGVLLDNSFADHRLDCDDCKRFDEQKPATGALMCLEGAVLYKRDNARAKPGARPERSEHYATKAQIQAAKRYRGD